VQPGLPEHVDEGFDVSRVLVTMTLALALAVFEGGTVTYMRLADTIDTIVAGAPPMETVVEVLASAAVPNRVPHTAISLPPLAVPESVEPAGQVPLPLKPGPRPVTVGGPEMANALSTPTTVRPARLSSIATAIFATTPTRDLRETDCSIEPTPRE
jgi:hypothetical protein